MFRIVFFLLLNFAGLIYGQYNLDYFINKAEENSPVIKSYGNLLLINNLQNKLDEAQNSAFQLSLTSNYLFAPFFYNNGIHFTANPDPNAIGYDAGITNGGLYSTLINVGKNIFNGYMLDALTEQRLIQGKSYENKTNEEKHNTQKQVTDQYLNTLQYLLLYNTSKEVVNNLNDQLKISSGQVSSGNVKVQDYLLLKIEAGSRQIDLDQTWQNYKSNLAELYSICGISDTQTVSIDSINLNINESSSGSNFLTQFILDSLSASNQQKVFETKYYPKFDIFFNAGLNAVDLNDMQRKFGFSAGLNFSLPILDGNQSDITRQQTYLSEQIISQNKKYLESSISLKRLDSENRIKSLKENIDQLKNQIDDYKKLLNISKSQLQQGNLTMLDYLTLIKNYMDLQKSSITTEINYQLEISNYNYWNW